MREKEKTVIINGRLIVEDGVIENAVVVTGNSRIEEYGRKDNVNIPEDAKIIDAQNNYIGPGFIDIHCHGGGGHFFDEKPYICAMTHLEHGTTSVLATLAYHLEWNDLIEAIEKIKKATGEKWGSVIAGIHMEGPYINPKYGSITGNARRPDIDEINTIMEKGGGLIRQWTLSPELPGIDILVDKLSNTDIVMSVGHSEATPEQIYRLIPKGLKIACHLMDATGTTKSDTWIRETRDVGVDEAVMVCDDIYAEVIPDSWGLHVRGLMLKLICKAKGIDKVIIITDSSNKSGTIDFKYIPHGDIEVVEGFKDVYIDEFDDLTGTFLTMDYAVRNAIQHIGLTVPEAFRMASLNPAKALGMDAEVGSIEKGKLANLIIVDDKIRVKNVIFQGKVFK